MLAFGMIDKFAVQTTALRTLAAVIATVVVVRVAAVEAATPTCASIRANGNRVSHRDCTAGLRHLATDRDDATFLRRHGDLFRLGSSTADLALIETKHGLASRTSRFQQTLAGLPVFGAYVSLTREPEGPVRSLHSSIIEGVKPTESPSVDLSSGEAVTIATATFGVSSLRLPPSAMPVWFPAVDRLVLAWKVMLFADAPRGDFLVIVDANTGEVLMKDDRLAADIGTAFAYAPNPVQSSGDTTLADNDDATEARLDAARTQVLLRGLDAGTGLLRGEFVDVASLSGGRPVPKADETNRIYRYDRGDPRFEQVNVYHTIDSIQRYIHTLGFDDDTAPPNGIRDYPTLAHAHWDSLDQSFYSVGDDALHFGDGGIDDAEDADIIAHEYGHAIQHDQNACWGAGQTKAMGEGFGDYLAASFFAGEGDVAYQAVNAPCIAEWDSIAYSTSSPPCLRRVDGNKRYPDDLVGQIHADGEIWSRALWDLRSILGSDRADRLVLEHHFTLPCDATMPDAALEILAADTAINAAANHAAIREVFCARGLLSGSDCSPFPELTLMLSSQPATAVAGGLLTYSFVASNRGTETLTGVAIEAQIPDGTTYVGGPGADGTVAEDGTVSWPPSTLAAGSSLVRELRVRVDDDLAFDPTFTDDIESALPAWSTSHAAGNFDWSVSQVRPRSGAQSWLAANPAVISDQRLELKVPVPLPELAVLRFFHHYETEEEFDGGVVEISTDGADWIDAGDRMWLNGYADTINATFENPLAGRRAFTGISSGYIETVVDLSDLAGESVAIRFRLATDTSVAANGWAIDDVEIVTESRLDLRAHVRADGPRAVDAGLITSVRAPRCGDGIVQASRAEECDDGNKLAGDCCTPECTLDLAGARCGDDDACNGQETCDGAGRCVAGPVPACRDDNPCTDDTCDPLSGCVHLPNTASCSDGNACNGDEVCSDGVCSPGSTPSCDDGNVCTDDTCADSEGCVHTPNSAPCGGGRCFSPGTCDGGACGSTAILDCDDGNPCTDDQCNPLQGCTRTANTEPCDDGDVCNGNERCSGGVCQPGTPLDCDDGNPCTDDTCVTGIGCRRTANTATCGDGNACNGTERCRDLRCRPGPPPDCDDDNPCTDDVCDVRTGCLHLPQEGACNDGDVCSVTDTCSAGACDAVDANPLTRTTVSFVISPGVQDDRVALRARFPSSQMRVRPSEGGLEVYLVDKDSEPLYAVDVDAEHFVDVGLRDRKFVLAAGAREGSELNGLRHIRIVRDLQHDRVRIRVKANGIDLTSATEVRALTLTLVFGEGETLTCMSRVGLACSSSGQKLLCQQEK